MKALVHSGGGSKGAHAAGVLKHLLGDLHTKYELLAGVSSGAINVAFLAQYPLGEELESITKLIELWKTLDNSKIYKSWKPFGKFHAVHKLSFYDSSPLHYLIRKHISLDKIRLANRQVSVGTVSLSTGKYHIFNQTSDYFIDAVIASSSFPVAMPPVKFLDQLWADGGLKEISPLRTAISLGASDIDVIITSPEVRNKKFLENPNILDILKRSLDLSTDKIMANDMEKVLMYNELARMGDPNRREVKLNIIRPKFNLIEDFLDFTPSKINNMIELGYKNALKHTNLVV